MTLEAFFNNYPLIAALIAMITAQLIKFPINILINKKIDSWVVLSTGGMPSSHSAFVTSLTVAIAIQYGVDSTYFAISTVFALIIMSDASGVRYQASKHAETLNILTEDFRQLSEYIKYKAQKDNSSDDVVYSPLKELLGHKPYEVVIGLIYGFGIAILVQYLYI